MSIKKAVAVAGSALAVSLAAMFFMGGCAPTVKAKHMPYVHSTVDFNGGKPFTTTVKGGDIDQLIRLLNAIAEKRELTIVKRECDGGKCLLVYKRADNQLSKTVGAGTMHMTDGSGSGQSSVQTFNITLSSRIFIEIHEKSGEFKIEAFGVPVLNNTLSCPDFLAAANECKPEMFTVIHGDSPAESFQALWNVDISGKLEAEIIQGIFAEFMMTERETETSEDKTEQSDI